MKLRQEKKYTIRKAFTNSYEKLLNRKGFFLHHEGNVVNNIYFENDALDSYLGNVNGDNFRKKFRLRWYTGDPSFILEEKIKLASSGFKNRIKLSSNNIEDAIAEVTRITNLSSTVGNRYSRRYYYRSGFRVTIDTDLVFYNPNSSTLKFYEKSIIEIKYDTEKLVGFNEIIAPYMQLGKFSKYVEGMERICL